MILSASDRRSLEKRHQQLGMNFSTATQRLRKSLLFHLAVKTGHVCHRCSAPLCLEDFSIEHVKPWLDSDDPVRLFFDLENIQFSHLKCNTAMARRPLKKYTTYREKRRAGWRRYRERYGYSSKK